MRAIVSLVVVWLAIGATGDATGQDRKPDPERA
jgi:hypothetical protein